MYYFDPFLDNGKKDGKYEVIYSATDNNGQSATLRFEIAIGNVYVPVIHLLNGESYLASYNKNTLFGFVDFTAKGWIFEKVNDDFALAEIDLSDKVIVTLTAPNGSQMLRFEGKSATNNPESQTKIILDRLGEYKITYTVTDDAGNEGTLNFTFKVKETPENNNPPVNDLPPSGELPSLERVPSLPGCLSSSSLFFLLATLGALIAIRKRYI